LIPLGQYIDHSASIYRATAVLAVALAFIGLLLTAIGVYGSVAYRTARRTREIGIRVALGAARAQVLRMVLHDGIRVWLAGVAIGLPAAMIATRLLSSLLFGVSPWDVGAFGMATAVLFLGVCGTTLIPAWRATRVSASDALRDA
jgi:ABC-type antimicrobial peptide transport system permease subunit